MSRDKATVREILNRVKAEGRTALTAPEGKRVCDAYGIAVPREGLAKTADEAAKLASSMGFPVVLKIVSPQILHKTEAGGVLVGVKTRRGRQARLRDHRRQRRKFDGKAEIHGVQVQQMLTGGQEVIVGAVTDPSFGKLVAFGLGGILVEVLKDVTFRLAPAGREEALSMLDGIAGRPGAQGRARRAGRRSRGAGRSDRARLRAGRSDFPEIVGDGPQPGVRHARRRGRGRRPHRRRFPAAARRYRPSQAEILRAMNRIMKPDAVAVIGASAEDGKIGNSVMKNLINGGYKGQIYPIHPKLDEILGRKAYKSVKDVPGEVDIAVFAIPAKLRAPGAGRSRREEDSGRHPHPVGLRRGRRMSRVSTRSSRSRANTARA